MNYIISYMGCSYDYEIALQNYVFFFFEAVILSSFLNLLTFFLSVQSFGA